MQPITRDILRLFQEQGDSQYGGEAVTQREHALQCAQLAQQSGASPALIVAALLHDVGHLLHALPEDAPHVGIDDQHETLAANWLQQHFPAAVVEPARLHVAAKRYLCATDAAFFSQLSPPSQLSLKLQGGPMSPTETDRFRAHRYFSDAVRLRQWDDAAKVAGLPTPTVADFADVVDNVLMNAK